jgi:hypothetical protein
MLKITNSLDSKRMRYKLIDIKCTKAREILERVERTEAGVIDN